MVAAWLRQRQFNYEYEPAVGTRNPDFSGTAPFGHFIVEVYEPVLRLPTGSTAFSSYAAMRGAFVGRKRKQAKQASLNNLPFVVALGRTNGDIGFDPLLAAGANVR